MPEQYSQYIYSADVLTPPVPTSTAGAAFKKIKVVTGNSTDSIQIIFGVPDPLQIEKNVADTFIQHQPNLEIRFPYALKVPKTLIGIEVEVENIQYINPNIPLLFWQIKTDGSLRNNGREFVTPALPAIYAESALKLLFEGLNSDMDFSQRTSVHVHLDIRQLTLLQTLGLLLTYTSVETLLFKFAGLTRRTNIFCVPIIEAGLLESLASSEPTRFLKAIDQHWSKYTAFNLLPITTLGTVEFRHLPGTNNVRQIVTWIDLLTRLKRHAYRFDLETIIGQISELNSNSRYKEYLELVFEDAAIYLDQSNLLNDMERAVYMVKNCILANKFHDKVKKTAEQESQFGKFINGWLNKLSKEQVSALTKMMIDFGSKDMERLFRDIVARPSVYYKAHPESKDLLDCLLKKNNEVTIKPTNVNNVEATNLTTMLNQHLVEQQFLNELSSWQQNQFGGNT